MIHTSHRQSAMLHRFNMMMMMKPRTTTLSSLSTTTNNNSTHKMMSSTISSSATRLPMAFVPGVQFQWDGTRHMRNTRFLCTSSSSSSSSSRLARNSFLQSDERRIADHAVHWGGRPGHEDKTDASTTTSTATKSVTAAVMQQQSQPHQPVPESSSDDTPTASLMDGKATAAVIRGEVRDRISTQVSQHGESARPGLAVVIVGDRPDSVTYVRAKHKACAEVGITSVDVSLSGDSAQADVERVVDELNQRPDVDGILVQLPLPAHLDEEGILSRVSLHKDVDGFHPLNVGRLCMAGRAPPLFIPCTPRAVIELLDRHDVDVAGKQAVVIGRSNVVGLPAAMLLMHRNATVAVCHSKTCDVRKYVEEADIVVAACGRPGFVKGEWIKQGAVVLDVGINAVEDKTKKKGFRLVGDVEFEEARKKARWITPVPGGIGPMTIAMLLLNTVDAADRRVAEEVDEAGK